MMTRMENKQIKFHMITIENLVPESARWLISPLFMRKRRITDSPTTKRRYVTLPGA